MHQSAALHALPRSAFCGMHHVCRHRTIRRYRVVRASSQQSTEQEQSAAAELAAAVPATTPSWSSCVSRRINIELAIEEAIEGASKGKPEHWEPELAVVFLSSAYVQEYGSLISLLRSKVPSLKYIAGSTVSNPNCHGKHLQRAAAETCKAPRVFACACAAAAAHDANMLVLHGCSSKSPCRMCVSLLYTTGIWCYWQY